MQDISKLEPGYYWADAEAHPNKPKNIIVQIKKQYDYGVYVGGYLYHRTCFTNYRRLDPQPKIPEPPIEPGYYWMKYKTGDILVKYTDGKKVGDFNNGEYYWDINEWRILNRVPDPEE